MTTFKNKTFKNDEIVVDGNEYIDCRFDNCVLVFEGGEPPVFSGCRFSNIKIQLQGDASRTTSYLNKLFNNGLPAEVEQVLDDVKTGFIALPDEPLDCAPVNHGQNYRTLALYAAGFTAVAVWLFGLYLFAYIIQPLNQLENNPTQPLRTEISFDLIPALPDNLAESYDLLREQQLDRLDSFEWVDRQAGVASIPIDQAIDVMLEEERFEVRDETGSTSPDDVVDAVPEEGQDADESTGTITEPEATAEATEAAVEATAEATAEATDAAAEATAEATESAGD